jgi:hypothetical protein
MKPISILLLMSLYWVPALAAKDKNFSIKVESDDKISKKTQQTSYSNESLETASPKIQYSESGYWSQIPKLIISGGFHGDKEFIENGEDKRWLFNTGLLFHHRNWYRFNINGLILQNNNFILSGSWEYTPSRKSIRAVYGIGLSHLMISSKEFRNFLEVKNYFLTGHIGIEYLLDQRQGLMAQAKAFANFDSYALQVTIGYIIAL